MRIKLNADHSMDREDSSHTFSNTKCKEVKAEQPFISGLQDDGLDVEHLLAEPKNDHVLLDGVLCIHEDKLGRPCETEKFIHGFAFEQKADSGGFSSPVTKFLDGVDEVGVGDYLNGIDGLPSPCEDYLLDFDLVGKTSILDAVHCGESLSRELSIEIHSPGSSGRSMAAGGVSEPSTVLLTESDCKSDSLDKTVTCGLHDAFRVEWGCQSVSEDGIQQSSIDIQQFDKLDNGNYLLLGEMSNEKNGKSFSRAGHIGAKREKRLRKPTQRYIEEFSGLKAGEKVLAATTESKRPLARSSEELHYKEQGISRKCPVETSICGPDDFLLSELCTRRGCPKRKVTISFKEPESDTEYFISESDNDYIKEKRSRKHDRRKHQRIWTLTEVNKLVDGISEYGVGQWTNIKRFLFSSFSHRTPIDLRDKWRNLVRGAQRFKREGKQNQQNGSRLLPDSVLQRVWELAEIHPYPKVQDSAKPLVHQIVRPSFPTQHKSDPITYSRRNSSRKKWCGNPSL